MIAIAIAICALAVAVGAHAFFQHRHAHQSIARAGERHGWDQARRASEVSAFKRRHRFRVRLRRALSRRRR